jgi:hypothetical protein
MAAVTAAGGAPLAVSFLMSGFEWTAPTPLVSAAIEQTVLMRDSALRSLPVSLLGYMNHKSVRKLVLRCRYWIVNNTGLPLLVRDGDNAERAHRRRPGGVWLARRQGGAVCRRPSLSTRRRCRLARRRCACASPTRAGARRCGSTRSARPACASTRRRTCTSAVQRGAVDAQHCRPAVSRDDRDVVSPRHIIRNATTRAAAAAAARLGRVLSLLANESMAWHWQSRQAEPLLQLSVLDERADVEWHWSGALSLVSLDLSCVKIDGDVRTRGGDARAARCTSTPTCGW